jgi:isocitrate lyase
MSILENGNATNGQTNGHATNGTTAAARDLQQQWDDDPRWNGIERPYTAEEVVRLRGSFPVEHTLARRGAERLWELLENEAPVRALGALTGNQAMQQVKAGLKAVYLSGWQVAADANGSKQMYPDQSLYNSSSAPDVARRINNTLRRADELHHAEGGDDTYWMAPIVADAEAGHGGVLHAFEMMKDFIDAGAAGVHFEDQLAAEKKCGHMGGKVVIPTRQFEQVLTAARFAADVAGVSTLLVARTDAGSAQLLTSDHDERDRAFVTSEERTAEGFYRIDGGLEMCIARGLAYAPLADLLWFETSTPDLEEAQQFADAIHEQYPGKRLAYNCSPSFNWKQQLSDDEIAEFQQRLGEMGYVFQFVTLAGFHSLNHGMFDLAKGYASHDMSAYSALQQKEFDSESDGYTATKHQREVGTGYFDDVKTVVTGGEAETGAMEGSTEGAQFA